MPIYGLEFRYNGYPTLRCFWREPGGLHAHLYTARGAQMRLDVALKSAGKRREYSLPALVPGDSLGFRYLRPTRSGTQSITKLHRLARKPVVWRRTPNFRFGLDLRLKTGELVRTSHPKRGGFSFYFTTIPSDHARVFFKANNRKERWHWQLTDLYAGEEVSFVIVETDWCDEPQFTE